jgi:hypothetical protein
MILLSRSAGAMMLIVSRWFAVHAFVHIFAIFAAVCVDAVRGE